MSLDPGQVTSFGSKFVGGLAPGNWDWVDLGQGKGASALGAAVQNGQPGNFSIGTVIGSAPGNKGNAGPLKKGLAARLGSCMATTAATDPCQNGAFVGVTMASAGQAVFRPPTSAWLLWRQSISLDAAARTAACR